FRLKTDVTEHLRDHGTLVVPSPQRAHAVRLAHAAARLRAGGRVWASADVHSSAVWLRREAERCAAAEACEWPRLLTSAEEWLLLRGFDSLAPRLRAIAAARQPRATPQAPEARAPSAATKILRAADTQEELERIAAWCRERVLAQPDARLLVILPGAPGPRERLATLIRQALDPRSVLAGAAPADTPAAIEGGQPLAQLPMIAHALTTLEWLAGREGDFEAFS